MLTIQCISFSDFTTQQLYEVLQLRSEVFVVEQDCVYQDIDSKDQKALHVLGFKDHKLVAYTRLFKGGDYFKEASIGRVVVREEARKFKLGYTIMEASIKAIENHFNTQKIRISAQSHLKRFYNNLGFKVVGDEYLEDGIPHVNMLFGSAILD